MDHHTTTARERLAHRIGKRCSVPGCFNPVNKFSQYCKHHDQVNQRTGHPLGGTVTVGKLETYKKIAMKFLDEQRDHPAMLSAGDLLINYLSQARPRRNISRNAPAWQRIDVWRNRLWTSGVDPIMDVLAVIVGMYLLQYYDSRTFRSDRHFWHQMVIRIFKLAKARKDAGAGHSYHRRVTVRERDRFTQTLKQTRLLSLGYRIARKIIQREEAAMVPEVQNVEQPFE